MLVGASQVVTLRGPARARRGPEMREVEVLADAAVAIGDDGMVLDVGPASDLRRVHADAQVQEVHGVLLPGLVDPHTHAVFGPPRLDDHERRALGLDYKTIAAEGGGILSTVRDTRAWSFDELLEVSRRRVQTLLHNGTTTVEVKTGYGLETETELRQLEIEYTKYFGGQQARPPLAQRARVQAILRRWGRVPMPWSTARFRYNTIQGRYRTLADMWDRGMRAREEGRPGPFSHKS